MQWGIVEIYTYFEGTLFKFETLHQGSIINYRSMVMNDKLEVNIKAKTYCQTLGFSKKNFEELLTDNQKLNKVVLMYNTQLLKKGKKYPLDYIQ